jgi:hypothetical protein
MTLNVIIFLLGSCHSLYPKEKILSKINLYLLWNSNFLKLRYIYKLSFILFHFVLFSFQRKKKEEKKEKKRRKREKEKEGK